MPYVNELI